MNKHIKDNLENGVMTLPMETSSNNFENFKLLIKGKVSSASKEERVKVALLGLKYSMEDHYQSRFVHHDIGFYIKFFLQAVDIRQSGFAKYLAIKPSNFSKILNGERKLNMELALILDKLSGIDANLWLNIQSKNELAKITKIMNKDLKKINLKQLLNQQ